MITSHEPNPLALHQVIYLARLRLTGRGLIIHARVEGDIVVALSTIKSTLELLIGKGERRAAPVLVDQSVADFLGREAVPANQRALEPGAPVVLDGVVALASKAEGVRRGAIFVVHNLGVCVLHHDILDLLGVPAIAGWSASKSAVRPSQRYLLSVGAGGNISSIATFDENDNVLPIVTVAWQRKLVQAPQMVEIGNVDLPAPTPQTCSRATSFSK